ncbi:bifunctional 2',3'-cyclic-nucleotide 2'-phosphodiesterase/3'-nucleotidase [Roseovarius sp. Pro17]|uniref:bifunctional 2',3'-cyclic-nucleotide 2'-phosphodiesterase/3'-nucleotidase n=1 Tax=Roseovarius sp. Pro17 TaxID=3108175 RepID=UPI002D79D785|nr:bifunctional 2',3'-cyclic-nucleotide 2'-phosphodiesterase/3'-nucleotidase [Roseovarius sp. Pro17]
MAPISSLQARETAPVPAHGTTAGLRLLGTTDLHAHLMAYDYYADAGDQPYGLTRIATLIRAARTEVRNTLLFDNGDALQGTPMGDLTTGQDNEWPGANPVIDAMNRLHYDAATLGNHEFNFGLSWLARTLRDADFPFTCANISPVEGRAPAGLSLPSYLLLRRTITCDAGTPHALTVGVLGLVPPQIVTWDHAHLAGRLHAHDMVETARAMVPRMRADGADIVLLLAHSGIDSAPRGPMMENAALELAGITGVDAIMAGHSHDLFPQPGAPGAPGVDHGRGLLSGTPAVMAGAGAAHIGVIDLALEACDGRWQVTGHSAEARPVLRPANGGVPASPAPCDAELARALAPAHQLTLRHMQQPIGQARTRLHSYLAMARSDPSVAAMNGVQTRLLSRALAGTAHEGLPVLSATPAFKTGGRGGPRNFTDLPAGPLSLRHAADLYPFPNHLCGVLIDGAALRDWLERAAICFATIHPGAPEGMLRDYTIPGHDFDVISGLTYRIDLTEPPSYDRYGARIGTCAGRIRDLRHAGQTVQDDARFILATNTYRANGAGAFAPTPSARIVHVADAFLRDQLVDEIAQTPLTAPPGYEDVWRFEPIPGATAMLDTGLGLGDGLNGLDAEDLGVTSDGFRRLRLRL